MVYHRAMDLWHVIAVIAAGFGAGAINTIVGSGSLITYPVMVMLGVPPVSANIANSVGLVPGSVAGVWGYREELRHTDRTTLGRLAIASCVGAIVGAFLLTQLPSSTFKVVVPFLILFAALLVAFQPRIAASLKPAEGTRWVGLLGFVFAAGVYGGYFSAAQGVILLGVLGIFLAVDIQEQNAIKNLLQCLVNIVAGLFFIARGAILWQYAGLVAVGSIVGALAGAWLARRIPAKAFRIFIVVFGLVMAAYMGYRATL